jgi:TolA-binding protein
LLPIRDPSRLLCALLACGALSCATGNVARDSQVDELRAQLASQAEQLKQQGQRIEELELRLAAVAARSSAAAVQPSAAPAPSSSNPSSSSPAKVSPAPSAPAPHSDPADAPPKALQTVKLHPQSGRVPLRAPRPNPVERAPRLPSTVQLKEPDEERLAELDQPLPVDPNIRAQAEGDHAFAQAVQQLNAGDFLSAQTSFLSFAHRWPRDASADNAVYFAGLARAASHDCAGALPLFDRVMHDYPAGDARVPARLEKGRCLFLLGRDPEARAALDRLVDESPDSIESQQARALLSSHAADVAHAVPVR